MAGEYIMNWSDDAVKAPFTINTNTRDETTTALTLFGKDSPDYGEGMQENLIRLLENFCSSTAPDTPTVGQEWFDFANMSMKFWNGTAWIKLADDDHANSTSLHLSTAQNTLLDGLAATLTATELNYMDGVTSNVQTQLNARYTKTEIRTILDNYGVGLSDMNDMGGDTNTLGTSGFYYSTGTNTPTVSPAFLIVMANGTSNVVQHAIPQGSNTEYVRNKTGAVWSAWREVAFTDNAALSGTPTAPTAPAGTNTTQISTTAFVQTAIANLVATAPSTMDTLNELAAALGDDPNFATTMTNALAGKQASLGFTPVQQGTGVDQTTNPVKIGWSAGSRLKATVDSTDLGNIVFDTHIAGKANLSGAYFTGLVSVPTPLVIRAQDNALEGGQIWLKKGSLSGLTNDIAVDLYGTEFRIYETGGAFRGVRLDLSACSDSIVSVLLTDDGAATLKNKTINLSNNTMSGTIAQFNAACSDADFSVVGHTHSYAPLDSPAFSGTPTAPTPPAGSYTLGVATTQFVWDAIYSYDAYKDIPSYGSVTWSGSLSISAPMRGMSLDVNGSAASVSFLNDATTFPVGGVVTITNMAGTACPLYQGGGAVLQMAGTSNTGNRTLGAYGVATARKVAANTWRIAGVGLT